jgi:hypothetical protein
MWWKRHVIPGRNGRVQELEEALKEMVANQIQLVARVRVLEMKLQEQIIENERFDVMLRVEISALRDQMYRLMLEMRLRRLAL